MSLSLKEIQNENMKLKNENINFEIKNKLLEIENKNLDLEKNTLKIKYKQLEENYIKLQNEYSENTIIQSMNDMKIQYENLNKINSHFKQVLKYCTNALFTCRHSIDILISKYPYNILEKKLIFINEIIDDALKKKDDIYY